MSDVCLIFLNEQNPDKFCAGHIDVVAIISFRVKNKNCGTRVTTSINRIL